jgi:hypothetical protein
MTLYAVIWGQCSEQMRNKLSSLDDFQAENLANNCTWILGAINGITHQFHMKQSIQLSLLEAQAAIMNFCQSSNQLNADYLAVFTANVQVMKHYWSIVGEGESYIKSDDPLQPYTPKERAQIARDKMLRMAFLRGSDHARYGNLWSDLANQKARDHDQYPLDLTSAYSMLVNYHPATSSC